MMRVQFSSAAFPEEFADDVRWSLPAPGAIKSSPHYDDGPAALQPTTP
jgi:hypothetical protein